MEVFRNDKKIGYSNYFFEHHDDLMTVKNYTQFEVKLFDICPSAEALYTELQDKTFKDNPEMFTQLQHELTS